MTLSDGERVHGVQATFAKSFLHRPDPFHLLRRAVRLFENTGELLLADRKVSVRGAAVTGDGGESPLEEREEPCVERLQDVRAVGREAQEDDGLLASRLHHLQVYRGLVSVKNEQQRTLLGRAGQEVLEEPLLEEVGVDATGVRPSVQSIRRPLCLVANSSRVGLGVDDERGDVLSSCAEARQDGDVVPQARRWPEAQAGGFGQSRLLPTQLKARLVAVEDLPRLVSQPLSVHDGGKQTEKLIHSFLSHAQRPPAHDAVGRLNGDVLLLSLPEIEPPRLAEFGEGHPAVLPLVNSRGERHQLLLGQREAMLGHV